MISVTGEITLDTGESTLRRTIALIYTTAYRASTRRIPRVNGNNRHPGNLSLVFYLLPKIVETPRIVLSPLNLANRYPITDAREFFQGDSASGAFCSQHQLFGDTMVDVFGKTRFLVAALCKQSLSRLRTFTLQAFSKFGVALSQAVDLTAGVYVTVAVRRYIDDAKVNAKVFCNVSRFWSLHITGSEQVELTINQGKITLSPLTAEQFSLPVTAYKRDALPAIDCPDRDFRLANVPGKDTVVKGNASMQRKHALFLPVDFIGVRNFGDAAYNYLGGKGKFKACGVVGKIVQVELTKCFMLPCPGTDMVASGIGSLKCLLQRFCLFSCWGQFDFSCQFHAFSIPYLHYIEKGGKPLSSHD